VAKPEHLELLRQGVEVWNKWRSKSPSVRPDLFEADLSEVNLSGADLSEAILGRANLSGADLSRADLNGATLIRATLVRANLKGANLSRANIVQAYLSRADLSRADLIQASLNVADLREANLSGAKLNGAIFIGANLSRANLSGATLNYATLGSADLSGANLRGASLSGANLEYANLCGADLTQAYLSQAVFVKTNLTDAVLTGCNIWGVSAWGVKLSEGTKQRGLIISATNEPEITVDDLEVAQFVYLLLHNEKIRRVIDTVGKKGVLLLGRFTEGRIEVLNRLRDALRRRGYVPIVFNFDKPETKDFTETVRLLAGLSKFVIADITNPKSAPLELQATVPEIMVPFRPIIEEGEKPFAMLQDLWSKHHDWVFEPIYYSSVDALIASLDDKIIKPAEARFVELVKRKAETMGGEHV
jgi:uncharacterized protein YjbI with pentapeptide repeats